MSESIRFLESEFPPASAADALFHIIPAPLEKTVSYGSNTSNGPAAILHASQQLEAFDGISYPGEAGIYTAPLVNCDGSIEEVLNRIEAATREVLVAERIPVVLGGEHSLTQAPVRAIAKLRSDFGVVQIDAHADLRDAYEGSPYSHACVMRRIVDLGVPIFQIGVRNLCREEVDFREKCEIPFLDATEFHRDGLPDDDSLLPADFPNNIYVTFDVDGLDASLMPATGTPEPGGLFWHQAISVLNAIVRHHRQIIGIDVVELAPIDGFHAYEYVAAKLTYALMGIALRSRRPQ